MLAFTQSAFLRRKRRTPISTPVPPAPPLHVVSALAYDYFGPTALVEIVFDNAADDPIVNIGDADGANWTARLEDRRFIGQSPLVLASYNTITLTIINLVDESGANVINFAASPADIVTASGRTLAAMENFPLGGP